MARDVDIGFPTDGSPLPCPEFSASPPGNAPPVRLDNIETFLHELSTFCKATFGEEGE